MFSWLDFIIISACLTWNHWGSNQTWCTKLEFRFNYSFPLQTISSFASSREWWIFFPNSLTRLNVFVFQFSSPNSSCQTKSLDDECLLHSQRHPSATKPQRWHSWGHPVSSALHARFWSWAKEANLQPPSESGERSVYINDASACLLSYSTINLLFTAMSRCCRRCEWAN